MQVFDAPDFDQHELVLHCQDRASGLRALIALHDTTLGPALGGCRMWPYGSEDDALRDVLRLSRGMTYKAALAGLPFGGGKAVIIGDCRRDKTPALMAAFGRKVEALGGRYVTAEDVGTTVADMDVLRKVTRHVLGISGSFGDPSPATARGVLAGIRAALAHRLGNPDPKGRRIALQGLGNVGFALARLLREQGARLVVADIHADACARAAAELGAEVTTPDKIAATEADVFSPCALGGVLNDDTIPRLNAPIIAGSANNQLADARHGAMLAEKTILYAPDYAINAGGLIYVGGERLGWNKPQALARVDSIGDTLAEIFRRAEAEGRPTAALADELAEERLRQAREKKAAEAA
ncbi:Glu/Leu/Phe/Val dehydrogenase dimerization domain-containing protein [Telmatospirillum sp. J64-1]|uniref:Glu/Leu/Phe/Val dehydrogenase dimerization domain-containing protein n=1 Tax=Telmatospirillum sp. J64-1 TaxID=2502183 RepID=UPI00115D3C6F|nr:Glu/Leu/Phe/Val dehydrogenase dimerization domain-containing protein [Telmatospirillum sp. J64-1]